MEKAARDWLVLIFTRGWRLLLALAKDHRPDVSIVLFGGNDVQGLYMTRDLRGPDGGRWIIWQNERWPIEYARRVNELCDILAPDGQVIIWIGLPVMRPERFREKCQRVNTIYRAEMAIRRRAYFVETWSVLADVDGNYADKLCLEPTSAEQRCKRTRVRASDGIHIAAAGAKRLETYIIGETRWIFERAPATHEGAGG